jgi:hypothetical protein
MVKTQTLAWLMSDQIYCSRDMMLKPSASVCFQRQNFSVKMRPNTLGQRWPDVPQRSVLLLFMHVRELGWRQRTSLITWRSSDTSDRLKPPPTNMWLDAQVEPSPASDRARHSRPTEPPLAINDWMQGPVFSCADASVRSGCSASFSFSKSATASPLLPTC